MSKPTSNSYALIKRLTTGYLKPHSKRLIIAAICMVIVSLTTAGIAVVVEPMIDKIFIEKNESLLYIIPMVIIVLFFVKGIASYFQSFLMEYTGQKIVADLQYDLYKHIIYQDLAFFQRHNTSDLSSRFLFDLHRLKQSISQTITGSLRDFTTIVGLIGVMFYQDWQMAIIALFGFPLAAYPIVRFGRKIRHYAVGTQEEMGSLAGILKESFSYNRQVKTYTMEKYEIDRAKGSIYQVFWFLVKAAKVRAMSSPIMELLGGFSIALIVFYGGSKVMAGTTTPGTFFSFMTALMTLYRPIKGIANINNVLQEGLASADRTFNLIDQKPAIANTSKTKLKLKKGEIIFKNVSFKYPDGTNAIHNLNLTIPAGKTIALVGSSGAGKSTILNLVPRFFEANKGTVTIDGKNITKVSLESLRQNIGLVTQDVAMFDDTVYNNIAYGNPKASREDIIAAAKAAAADDFINQLDNGYDTQVGEEGLKLSGGQKQRIAIARAMLKNAPILLLDEATSSLDSESEAKVQKALQNLMQGRTSLIVAHRLSTIAGADCIYVLKQGEIVESGTHKALMAKKGFYSQLYNLQSGE